MTCEAARQAGRDRKPAAAFRKPPRRRLSLAAARAEKRAKQFRSTARKYEIVRDLALLKPGSRARSSTAWSRSTPRRPVSIRCRRRLCGFSLAVAPNEACYVPLAHRKGGGRGSVRRRSRAATRLPRRDALAAIKPLLEDPGVLKIGQNLKFDMQIFALRGIALAPHDDTMLMSYVLDAGRSDHGLEPLSQRYFAHTDHRLQRGHRHRQIARDLRLRRDRQGRRIRRRGRRRHLAAVAYAQARGWPPST